MVTFGVYTCQEAIPLTVEKPVDFFAWYLCVLRCDNLSHMQIGMIGHMVCVRACSRINEERQSMENAQPRELTEDELDLVAGGDFSFSISFNNTEPNLGVQIDVLTGVTLTPFSF